MTQQTLDLLDDEYFFEMGTEEARKDLIFRDNNIRTYLISPQSNRYVIDSQFIAQEDPSSRRISKGIDYLMRKRARVCLMNLLKQLEILKFFSIHRNQKQSKKLHLDEIILCKTQCSNMDK